MSSTNIGLFYGSSTCYTEIAAEKIQAWFAEQDTAFTIALHDIKDSGVAPMLDYPLLILGIPTWDYGELQEDWENQWGDFCELDFTGKTVALYGLGDQIGYPEWFQDALGYLHQQVTQQGGKCIGYWPADGYEFDSSMALTEDHSHFVGLALDEENEFDLSEERIERWCRNLLATLQERLTAP